MIHDKFLKSPKIIVLKEGFQCRRKFDIPKRRSEERCNDLIQAFESFKERIVLSIASDEIWLHEFHVKQNLNHRKESENELFQNSQKSLTSS